MPFEGSQSRSLRCPGCDYDLRGTSADGVCPECGLAVRIGRGGFGVEGDRLVLGPRTILPPICIKTGEPVHTHPIVRTLYYVHPAFHLLLLVHPFIWVIMCLVVRKPVQLTYHLGRPARRRLAIMRAVLGSSLVCGVAAVIVTAAVGSQPRRVAVLAAFFGVLLLIEGIVAFFLWNPLRLNRQRDRLYWLSGCGEGFIDALREGEDVENTDEHG